MKTIVSQDISILELLKQMAPDSSANTLRSWIEKGRVNVDGRAVRRAKQLIMKGQSVEIGPRVNFIDEGIKIIYEDEELVVIEKPEGLLSVATDFSPHRHAHNILKRRFHTRRVFPVHRLDRETSGVMIFAYTEEARDALKKQFEERQVEKVYAAVVEGRIKPDTGTWQSYLQEDETYHVNITEDTEEGKLAITHYEVIAQNSRYSLLKLRLETGRKNQLRVHCSNAGIPMVGDEKYGAVSNPIKRLCLHSKKITFTHPRTQERLTFETPLPDGFRKLVKYN